MHPLTHTMRIILFAVFLNWGLLGAQAWAQMTCPQHPIRVQFRSDSWLDPDLIAELQKRSKCVFEPTDMPRARIWAELESGTLDAANMVLQTPERAQYMRVVPYLKQRSYALIARSAPPNIRSLEDLLNAPPDVHWGAMRKVKYSPSIDVTVEKMEKQGRMDFAASNQQLYQMLKAGRFIGMFAIPIEFRARLTTEGLDNFVNVQNWNAQDEAMKLGLALSHKTFSAEQAYQFSVIVADMYRDGTMQKLLAKRLSPQEVKDSLYFEPPAQR